MQTRNLQIPSNLINELGVPQMIDITDDLPKNQVRDWDALNPPRAFEALTDIVWHHTAIPLKVGADAARHAKNHIESKTNETTGDGGFPYTFYINRGQIYQCNDLLTFVYAVSGNNGYTVNCCVEGLYCPDKNWDTYDQLSDEDTRCMIALELTLRGLLTNYKRTNGHNYYNPKACPGYSMDKFREAVTAVQQRLEWKDSTAARTEMAFRIANTILWTRNTAQGLDQYGKPTVSEGGKAWALERLLLLEPAMREHGFIQ